MGKVTSLFILANVIFALVTALVLEIVGFRFFLNKKEEKKRKQLVRLFSIFSENIWEEKKFIMTQIPQDLLDIPILVEVIEKIDETICDKNWNQIKSKIFHECLHPWAKKAMHSKRWKKRCYALRILSLHPGSSHEEDLVSLLKDQTYFIRLLAAKCVKHFPSKNYVRQIIVCISSEPSTFRYPYINAIVQAGDSTIQHVKEIYQNSSDEKIKEACLEVLSNFSCLDFVSTVSQPKGLIGLQLRKAILTFMGRQPCKASIDFVASHLDYCDPFVREAAVNAIALLLPFMEVTDFVLRHLEAALSDSSQNIRAKSAQILRQLGNNGLRVLQRQDPNINSAAYEVSRYAITNDF